MTKQKFYTYILRAIGASLALFQTILVTNRIGPEESGHFFLALNIVMILSVFSNYGLNTYCLKKASAPENKAIVANMVWSANLKITFPSVFLMVILIILSDQISEKFGLPILSDVAQVMALTIFSAASLNIFSATFQGLGNQVTSVFLANIIIPLSMVMLILLASEHLIVLRSIEVAWIYVISSALALVAAIFFFSSEYPRTQRLSYKFKNSGNYWVINILSVLIAHGSLLAIGLNLNATNYANISVIIRVINLYALVHVSMMLFYTPEFCRINEAGESGKLKNAIRNSTISLLTLTVPLIVATYTFSDRILGIFGADYVESSWMLEIALITPLINSVCLPATMAMTVSGREAEVKANMGIAAFVSIILGFYLSKNYGVLGAIISASLALFLHNLLCGFSYIVSVRIKNESF